MITLPVHTIIIGTAVKIITIHGLAITDPIHARFYGAKVAIIGTGDHRDGKDTGRSAHFFVRVPWIEGRGIGIRNDMSAFSGSGLVRTRGGGPVA